MPEAWAALTELAVPYAEAVAATADLRKGPLVAAPLVRAWCERSQVAYRRATSLAEEGR